MQTREVLQSDIFCLWGIDEVDWLHKLLITQTALFTNKSHMFE